MISSYHGFRTDLPSLRSRFSVSLKGSNFAQLMRYGDALNLGSRAVRLEPKNLESLKMPCILHWDLNHFVVLKSAETNGIVIHDPSVGVCRLSYSEVGNHFTGLALEFTPSREFQREDNIKRIRIRSLMGDVEGLWKSLAVVFAFAIALEIFALASPLFNQWIVDEALVAGDRDMLNVLVFGFMLLLVVQMSISLSRTWTVLYISTHLNLQWASNVFTHLLRLPVVWFEKRHLGDVVSRFGSIQTIQRTLTTSFVEAILDGLMAIATFVMMITYSPKLTMIVVVAVALYAAMRAVAYGPLREASAEGLALAAKEQSCFLETIRGVQSIKLFGKELDRRSRWLNFLVDSINRQVRTQKFMMWFQIANSTVFGGEALLVFWMGAHLVLDGGFTVGMLFCLYIVFVAIHRTAFVAY